MKKELLLIADDQKMNRLMLSDLLKDEYDIAFAENGVETMEILNKAYGKVSCLLLDITMPEMDGFEVLKAKAKDASLKQIPTIILTSIQDYETEIEALSLGAIDFITKPYRQEIVRQKVKNIVMLRNSLALNNKLKFDSVTGAYTREYFFEKCRNLISEKNGGIFDMISIEIERFRFFIDTFGEDEGDRFLRHVADGLRRICPTDNTAYGHIATDLFAVFHMHDDLDRKSFISNLQSIVHGYDLDTNLTLKIGVYELDSEEDIYDFSELHNKAHIAAGYNTPDDSECYALYDEKMRQKALNEQYITHIMHESLRENQFLIYLQPKVKLETNKIEGAEALVRWIHPEKGFMPPDEFIPLFEANGFIYDLDKYVWERTCKYIATRIALGKKIVPISVNVSRRDLLQPDFVDFVIYLIEKYKLSFDMLHLEITESSYIEDPDNIIRIATKLKRAGFILEMDDFGSGYSSLNMLTTFPIDILKIDKAFLDNEDITGENNIVRFIVYMANGLKLTTVCEGVETKEQLEALKEMGADYMQGYYFSKPLPAKEFFELLEKEE